MTRAYQRFLEFSRLQGREYGDGYVDQWFAEMDAAELHSAVEALTARAASDSVAMNALANILTPRVVQYLSSLSPSTLSPSVAVEYARALLRHDFERGLAKSLLLKLALDSSVEENLRSYAIAVLAELSDASERRDVSKQLLSFARDQSIPAMVKGAAARAVLFLSGRLDSPTAPAQEYLDLIRAFRGGDARPLMADCT